MDIRIFLSELSTNTRKGIAKRTTFAEIHTILLEDENPYVRAMLAENSTINSHIVSMLCNDDSYIVAIAVAKRPDLEIENLEKIFNSHKQHPNVLSNVASNPAATPELLAELMELSASLPDAKLLKRVLRRRQVN